VLAYFIVSVLGILDTLSNRVGKGLFFQCVWLALLKVPRLRNASLAYLLKRMPKVENSEDIAVVLGDETGLLASAFCAGLGDRELLVQRNCLELLLVHFPLKIRVFGKIHLEAIMKAVLGVVLRKDMSLNRRLYAWLDSSTGIRNDLETQTVLISAVKVSLIIVLKLFSHYLLWKRELKSQILLGLTK
jgi:hypothetical protein